MRHFLILILLIVACSGLHAQNYSSDSRKAIRKYEEAVEQFKAMDPEAAKILLQETLDADESFVEAHQLLSQIFYDSGRLDDAINHYGRALELDSTGNPEAYRILAGMQMEHCDYAAALELIEHYLGLPPGQTRQGAKAMYLKEQCLFALEAMKHPVPFEPRNLGDSVNSEFSEYWPSLSVDEQLLIFTVLVTAGRDARGREFVQEDFYVSRKEGDQWQYRKAAAPPLNTGGNEGAHSMTADGNFLYFTACDRKGGRGQCDLYVSERTGDQWSSPQNLGAVVNSPYSDKQPSISADGRILIFSSNRPGGMGGYDLWMSVREKDAWTRPVNLGPVINSTGLEQSPFLHSDMHTLYFSSTGWPGMGQGDLFRSTRVNDSTWTAPDNLGYPINTCRDEFGLSVNASGTMAYFASDRERRGDTDIYSFEMPPSQRPTPVSYMTGRVYDAGSIQGVKAYMRLMDLEDGTVVMDLSSNEGEGDFLLALPADRDYALNVSAPGYLFYSEHFAFRGIHSLVEPFRRDVPLQRISVGSSVVLHNIFFETDSHALLPESEVELSRILDFLEQNTDVSIEIGGHTDNSGSSAYNQVLSEKRASTVIQYLVEHGIDTARMKSVGYGDSQPVMENSSEEGRALNRRTEFKIINIAE